MHVGLIRQVSDDVFELDSLPCPVCWDVQCVVVGRDVYDLLFVSPRPLVQDVLHGFDADVRERFVSGFCPKCWSRLSENAPS